LADDEVCLMPGGVEEWETFHHVFWGLLQRMELKHTVLPGSVVNIQDRLEFLLMAQTEKATSHRLT
jgi:hypothetical protein